MRLFRYERTQRNTSQTSGFLGVFLVILAATSSLRRATAAQSPADSDDEIDGTLSSFLVCED